MSLKDDITYRIFQQTRRRRLKGITHKTASSSATSSPTWLSTANARFRSYQRASYQCPTITKLVQELVDENIVTDWAR
ncbi:MAG: hypothetical protein ACLRM8_07020 [Alistipes sp.]